MRSLRYRHGFEAPVAPVLSLSEALQVGKGHFARISESIKVEGKDERRESRVFAHQSESVPLCKMSIALDVSDTIYIRKSEFKFLEYNDL